MEEKIVKTMDLENGLRIDILDSSRRIAGDRWQVVVTVRVDIPVEMLAPVGGLHADLNVADVVLSIGEFVRFEQKKERNFIDENHKDDILKNLIDSSIYGSIDYVSKPDFPQKYILRKYKEHLKRKSWYPESQNEE